MSLPDPSPAMILELETAAAHAFISKCMFFAGVCILMYDHILTFADEVRLIWKQKWSLVSTMFVLNRYITPIALAIDIYDKGGLRDHLSHTFCIIWYYGETVWVLVCFAIVHALVALRVHAIWGRARWVSITLSVSFVTYLVSTTIMAYKFQHDVADTVDYSPIFRLCFVTISPYLWSVWIPALLFESVVFALTIIKAREYSDKNFNRPVLFVLYRDGILYFVIICACNLFNMLVWLVAPHTLAALSKYFTFAVVPAMGARLVLNLRGSNREDIMPTGPSTTDDAGAFEMKGRPSKHTGERAIVASDPSDDDLESRDRHFYSRERAHSNQIKGSHTSYVFGRDARPGALA